MNKENPLEPMTTRKSISFKRMAELLKSLFSCDIFTEGVGHSGVADQYVAEKSRERSDTL